MQRSTVSHDDHLAAAFDELTAERGGGSADAASQGDVNAELLKSRPALRPGDVLEFGPSRAACGSASSSASEDPQCAPASAFTGAWICSVSRFLSAASSTSVTVTLSPAFSGCFRSISITW